MKIFVWNRIMVKIIFLLNYGNFEVLMCLKLVVMYV